MQSPMAIGGCHSVLLEFVPFGLGRLAVLVVRAQPVGRAWRLVPQLAAQPVLTHQPLDRARRHSRDLPSQLPVQLVPDLPHPVVAVVLLVQGPTGRHRRAYAGPFTVVPGSRHDRADSFSGCWHERPLPLGGAAFRPRGGRLAMTIRIGAHPRRAGSARSSTVVMAVRLVREWPRRSDAVLGSTNTTLGERGDKSGRVAARCGIHHGRRPPSGRGCVTSARPGASAFRRPRAPAVQGGGRESRT